VVRLENTVVCAPGPVVHVLHTRPVQYAHHRLLLELGACTLDTDGPLVALDSRPYRLEPAPLTVKATDVLFTSRSAGLSSRPPQVLWQSPVEDKILSTVVRWAGKGNCYFQRGAAFQAKTPAGPVVTLVDRPDGWA